MSRPSARVVVSLLLVASAVGVLAPLDAGASGGKMYWFWLPCYEGGVQRANLDGTGLEDLFGYNEFGCPEGLAVDVLGRKIYWTDSSYYDIERANLDGSGREWVVDAHEPARIALDVVGRKVYWSEGTDKIRRANLDGSGVEDVVTRYDPWGIALDVTNGKIYWTELYRGNIRRANLDGTGVEDALTGLLYPGPIALDVPGGKMYWVGDYIGGYPKIHRANLDGTEVEELIAVGARGLALDVAGGKMYWPWSQPEPDGKIQRANLDGTGVEDVLTGLDYPEMIALDLRVGGSAAGFQPAKVACRNITTGQRLKITPPPGAQSWDCQGAGLGMDPGDVLRMRVRGPALDPPIAASAINFEPSRVICRNFTTGQRVEIVLPPNAESWDCTAAGLVASPGDVVKMRVRGSVP